MSDFAAKPAVDGLLGDVRVNGVNRFCRRFHCNVSCHLVCYFDYFVRKASL